MSHKQNLEDLGSRILDASRTELFLSMRFMGSALDSLSYTMDLTTRTVGTDAVSIRFNPEYLMQLWLARPRNLNRLYVHMLLHCIFRHMFRSAEYEDAGLFDLCADISAEAILDTMEYSAVQTTHSDYRSEVYERLNTELRVLTAERLYQYFSEHPPGFDEYCRMRDEFTKDDHSFWARLQDQENQDPGGQNDQNTQPPAGQDGNEPPEPEEGQEPENAPQPPDYHEVSRLPKELEDEWKKKADRIKVEMEASGSEAADEYGSFLRTLTFVQKRRKSYRHFLKRFAALHEETKIDPDSFDYGYYQFGLELFGNIPLIEENEYREAKKIRTLCIAIDTSASCQDYLVQKFLNETADILARQESFFRRAEILIIECDDQVQEEIRLKDPEELKRYAEGFHIRGGFGTDFRPVFRRLEEMKKAGMLRNLKGMMYFTDGYGTFPEKPPSWETAFVLFRDEEFDENMIPDWAYALYLDGE